MITVEQLYQGTHEGLDIILMIYPQARAAVENPKLKFKVRRDERTPSAALWRTQTRAGTPVWKVVDYGDDGHAASPLDLYMRERGVRRPGEALVQLAEYFNIEGLRISPEVNRARWEERAAGETEQEGELAFELLEEIPEAWLPVLGPRVTRETTAALGWYGARYVGWVKNRRVKCEFSTEHYPILMRECVVPAENGEAGRTFYKIYKPLAMDKAWRFAYAPRGAKPRRYVNGLKELREAYEKYNSGNEREEKLGEAVICSGERDALCCRSLGYYPIWFNSETYEVSEGEIREIEKLVERIYNIPDIDQTGRRKGRELALRFPQIYTVWLPEWLAGYKDHRGRGRKDLRDWMELRGTLGDFEDLLRRAAPAKFWRARTGGARVEYSIDSVALLNFLELNGFHCLRVLQEIETLGGAKKVAAALGITPRAVMHWTMPSEWQFPPARRINQLISLYPPALRAEKEQDYRTLQSTFTRERKFHRPFLNEKHRLSNVISFAQNTNLTRQFKHPTQKHYVLTCQIIETLSRPGDIVLVPFAGSGTECQAAQNTGRRYIGYDIDPKYAEMARRRCLASSIPSLFK